MIAFFRSILEQDTEPVVICDLQHTILYMNPAATAMYADRGGTQLLGKNVMDCHAPRGKDKILQVLEWFAADVSHNRVHTMYSSQLDKDVYMIALRDREGKLIGYYEQLISRTRDTTPAYQM